LAYCSYWLGYLSVPNTGVVRFRFLATLLFNPTDNGKGVENYFYSDSKLKGKIKNSAANAIQADN
jgi:hypothetical protein